MGSATYISKHKWENERLGLSEKKTSGEMWGKAMGTVTCGGKESVTSGGKAWVSVGDF